MAVFCARGISKGRSPLSLDRNQMARWLGLLLDWEAQQVALLPQLHLEQAEHDRVLRLGKSSQQDRC